MYPFVLVPLKYPYDALEPYIDEKTMRFHHDEHLKKYVEDLNAALKDYPQFHKKDLDWLINNSGALPEEIRGTVRTRAGAVRNHDQYFLEMKNDENDGPQGELLDALTAQFGSVEKFKDVFLTNAQNLFGSGWTFLVADKREQTKGNLEILNLINQDRPSDNVWDTIMLTDVWEHAYYLQYQNRRREYLEAWWNVINWEKINQNYINAIS